MWLTLLLAVILANLAVLSKVNGEDEEADKRSKRPNIVFIFSDDQDLHMNSLDYMPYLQQHLMGAGTTFQRHYCTVSLCCPSRASLWTGKFSHNTNVTDLTPPYGGYPKFIQEGFNSAYLPVWLQAAGYSTYYVGKWMNYHNIGNYDKPHLANWTGSDFLIEPYTYQYYNPAITKDKEPYQDYSGLYNTDLLTNISLGRLDEAAAGEKPFFLTVAPIAPHSDVVIYGDLENGTYTPTGSTISPPQPAKRHEDLFPDVVVPRTPSFNPAEPHGVGWIAQQPRQNQTNIDYNDSWYRNRLRALQAVDEMIDSVVTKLDALGVLNDTFIFYSTDNGYHIGQHRLQPSKYCAYKEDVNIPLIVRGPGIDQNRTTEVVTSHTDLVPTFLTIAGAPLREDLDGTVIPMQSCELDQAEHDEFYADYVNLEQWGFYQPEGKYDFNRQQNSTYKGLRIVGGGYDLLYTVWCTGEHELYDLVSDPYETDNLYPLYASGSNASMADSVTTPSVANGTSPVTSLKRLIPRLDALLMVLKTCKGNTCRQPWLVVHPDGDVRNLEQALNPQFDKFYEAQKNHVTIEACLQGYFLSNEMPLDVIPYTVNDLERL